MALIEVDAKVLRKAADIMSWAEDVPYCTSTVTQEQIDTLRWQLNKYADAAERAEAEPVGPRT